MKKLTDVYKIENIYGRYLSSGFQVVEPFSNSFTSGLKSWPFNATGLVQAIVSLIFYLHELENETNKEPKIAFTIESSEGDNGLLPFSAEVVFDLKWLSGRIERGSNTVEEYLAIDQSV